jgi:hypothetical protein
MAADIHEYKKGNGNHAKPGEELRYEICVRAPSAGGGSGGIVTIARTSSRSMADAIFAAARNEHPGKTILLREDGQVIASLPSDEV